MERTLNLQTLSKPTQKKIRDAAGVKNVLQLIKLAKENGVDIGKRKQNAIVTNKSNNIPLVKRENGSAKNPPINKTITPSYIA